MEFENIMSAIINNGVAVGLLTYFVYRDNKFMSSLDVTLKTLQTSVDSVRDLLEKQTEKKTEKKKEIEDDD